MQTGNNIQVFVRNESDKENLASFGSDYYPEYLMILPLKTLTTRTRKDSKCRYCLKETTQTTFINSSHLIPKFLGNDTLFDSSECDNCNALFSKYENSFSRYLGFQRTMRFPLGEFKVPRFESADEKIHAFRTTFQNDPNTIKIEQVSKTKDAIEVDAEKGIIQFGFTKATYVPLYAFKSLVKIAFALLTEEEQANYNFTREFLTSNKYDPKIENSCQVMQFAYPPNGNGGKQPMMWIWRKTSAAVELPTHTVMLFWNNLLFQYHIPFNFYDMHFIVGSKYNWKVAPPVFFAPVESDIHVETTLVNFTSNQPKKGEKQFFRFQVEAPGELTGYNPKTGELVDSNFNFNDVAGVYITAINIAVNIPQKTHQIVELPKSDDSIQPVSVTSQGHL